MHRWLQWLRRRWLLLLIIIGGIVFALLNLDDLRRLALALIGGHPGWIGAAILAQATYYYLYAVQYKYAFATVEVASRVRELIPVLFASIFVRTLVPSGGAAGAALFIDDAARRKQSPTLAAEGALLVLVLDLGTMIPLIAYALGFLALRNALRAYQTVGSILFLLFTASLAAALSMGRLAPHLLCRLLDLVRDVANAAARGLGRPDVLPPDWSRTIAADFQRAANDIVGRRRLMARTVAVAAAAQLVNLVTLTFIGLAYGRLLDISTTIAAFSLEAVFSVVTLVPNGLIVAEAVMVDVLASLGLPFDGALVITIVYRGLSVWLPLLVGFIFLRQVRSLGGGGGE